MPDSPSSDPTNYPAPHNSAPAQAPDGATATTTNPAPGGASCAIGHSPVWGASRPRTCAPGVAQDSARQGADAGQHGAEGGPARKTSAVRPKKGRARARQKKQRPAVSVRLSTAERAEVQTAAERAEVSLAQFMATASLAKAQEVNRGAANLPDLRGAIRLILATRADLARIGNNINQVARAFNSGADPYGAQAAYAEFLQVAARLDAAAAALAERA
jgi:hypothetical protein